MKNIVYLFLLLFSISAYSQSLSVYNVNVSDFPTMKANFFALDSNSNQLTKFSNSDFLVSENGKPRTVLNIACQESKPPQALSSVLVMDVSGSMLGDGMTIAKAAANAWIDMLPLGKSECAITAFNSYNYFIQDFTTSKSKLVNGINNLSCTDGTSFNAALIDPLAGGILVSLRGRNKKVIVLISDGVPNIEPKTAQIINEAKANNITIYGVTIGMPAPKCMKEFCIQTGGLYFDNIRSKGEAEDCYRKILMIAQEGAPCEIVWQSEATCDVNLINLEVKLIPTNTSAKIQYPAPANSVKKLVFSPTSVQFLFAKPGIKRDTTITVTAKNSDFYVTNIVCSNAAYTITPKNFVISAGNSLDLKVSFIPADSGYSFGKFTFESTECKTNYYASGGFPGINPKIQTLKLIQPNGGEVFVVGMDTTITWEGILPDEKVTIEYTTDNGLNWILISDSAKEFSYIWKVPNTPSDLCIARVTSKTEYEKSCPEIKIGKQIWAGCNLDVEIYSNGEPIPEVQDPSEWENLKTGAWCYQKNDQYNGIVYGKLYNWYAVSDPRGLAPVGWHIPSDDEWTELADFLGGSGLAGGKLKKKGIKENGTGLWNNPNTGATNETGFSALPGGYRLISGEFTDVGNYGYWWSSTFIYNTYGGYRYISHNDTSIYGNKSSKEAGFSVRCVKD